MTNRAITPRRYVSRVLPAVSLPGSDDEVFGRAHNALALGEKGWLVAYGTARSPPRDACGHAFAHMRNLALIT